MHLVSGQKWVSEQWDFPSSFGICNQRYRIISSRPISSTRGLCMCQHWVGTWVRVPSICWADDHWWKIQWFFPLSINWVTSIVWLNRGLKQIEQCTKTCHFTALIYNDDDDKIPGFCSTCHLEFCSKMSQKWKRHLAEFFV